MRVIDTFSFEPISKEREVFRNLVSNENPIDHVATKQPHFYLVPQVRFNTPIFVNGFEDVGSS